MLRSYQGFFNQNATFTPDTIGGETNKFDFIASLPPGDTTTAWLTLSCMFINAYGRSIRAIEYGTNTRPLTSILVNRDNIKFTSPFGGGTGLGCTNYIDFFNAIASKHNLYSRMYPMGNTHPLIQYPYDIAANISVTETFSMAFVETSHGIPNFSTTGPTYLYYIETVDPMIIRSLIARPGVNGGFESLKTASNISRDSFWQKINLAPPA